VIRALAYLIFGILLLGILRSVIGMFAQLFTSATVGSQKRPAGPRSATEAQALKKDPVCGTFVAASTELQKAKDGQTYYFCSAACRDKFV
jgi:YHS domain-containing protein